MKAQDLKNSVLQLAIQGKLVEQNPNDEPASILLEKIKTEKEQLIKEKKIKREKSLPEISEEEKPFEIPYTWEWVRHNDIFEISGGSQPAKSNFIDYEKDGYIRLYQTRDYGRSPQPVYIPVDMAKKISQKGDILLARYGASLGKVFLAEDGAYNVALAKVIPLFDRELIDNRFLFWYYKASIYQEFVSNRSRSAQAGFNKEDLNSLLFPLPPLEEQKRIVAKLEEILEKIEEYDKVEKELSELEKVFPQDMKKSILQYAIQGKLVKQNPNDEPSSILLEKIKVEKEQLIKDKKIKREKSLPEISEEEKPFEIPDSWEWVRLGDIGSWGSGATPSRSNPGYYGGNIPWLKTGELRDGYICCAEEFITEEAMNKTSVKLNKVGSVLIAMYGATIGRLGILNIEATTNQACCACNTFTGIYNKYLFYYLLSQREELKSKSEGGAQPNISKEKIVRHLMTLPPLEEQKRIVAKIETIMCYIDRLEDSMNNKDYINGIIQPKSIELEKDLINN